MAAQMPERGPAVQPERRAQDPLLSRACSMPSWMPHPRVFSSTQSIRSGPTTEASCGGARCGQSLGLTRLPGHPHPFQMQTSPPAPPVLTRTTEPSPSLEGNPGHTAQAPRHRKGNRVQLDAEVVGPLGPLLQPAIHRCGHGIQTVVEVGDVIGPPLACAPGQPEPQEPSILRPRPGHFQNSKRAHGPTSNGIERLALCSGRRRSTASTNGQVPVRARPGGQASSLSGFDTRTIKPVGFPEIEIEPKGRAVYGDRVSAGHATGLCMDREEHKQTGAPRPKSGESLPLSLIHI